MRIQPVDLAGSACFSLALAVAACNTVPAADYAKCQRELITTQSNVRQLQEQVAAQEQANAAMKSEVAQGLKLKPAEYADLVVPVRIELGRQSGGYSEENKVGDAGIVLYVQPIDRDGDVVKAAGSIKVTLLDLANPPDQYVIGTYYFDVQHTRKLWYGQLWTHHYTVRCPWYKGIPPRHDEITARVEFTDLLTGRVLTTQGVYKIKLPPGGATTAEK